MAERVATDERLIAAYRAGDDRAFAHIFERHGPVLERYARKVLGKQNEHAEDVVQEAMLRASRALRRDERQIALRPWLFRLVRNCALDELSRVRTDSVDLDVVEAAGALRAAPHTEPEEAHERRQRLRSALGDLALLPEPQRHALLRREVDGVSHAQLATELGITPQATKNLVFRARTNLVKQEEARSTDHAEVQRALLEAHDAHRRASAAVYRHLATCRDCRAFRAGLRTTRHSMALLSPGPLLFVGLGVGATIKAMTGTASAAGKGVAVKAGATAAAGAMTVGAVGVGLQVFGPGDPAPQRIESIAVPRGEVAAGRPLPGGTAVVRRQVRLAEGVASHPRVSLACPPGMRVADLLPASGTRVSATYASGTRVGVSRVAEVVFASRTLARPRTVRVAVLCRRPDAEGSLVPGRRNAFSATNSTRHVRVADAYLHSRPEGGVLGSVRLGQPVRVLGTRGAWTRVATDVGERGWVRSSALR